MSPIGAAPRAAVPVSNARAEASRRNGGKSRGPKTPEGKARSARNALKHGMRAEKYLVLPQEDAAEFQALQAALVEELAPQGVLQSILVGRIARAAWRLERAERIEAELFGREMRDPFGDGDLGLALIRDGNGARAFDTLLRYRAAAQTELFRTLRALKALRAEAAQEAPRPAAPALLEAPEHASLAALPNQPEARGNPGESGADAASSPASPLSTTLLTDPARAILLNGNGPPRRPVS